jgi:hypothetical protein
VTVGLVYFAIAGTWELAEGPPPDPGTLSVPDDDPVLVPSLASR